MAEGLERILQRGRPGRRYLLSGENLTLSAVLSHLSELTGVPVPRWRVPYSVGLAVAYASEFWADQVSGRSPRATLTGLRLARRIMHFDPSRSRAELGLRPRDVRQSLASAVAWLQDTGQLNRRASAAPVPGRPDPQPRDDQMDQSQYQRTA